MRFGWRPDSFSKLELLHTLTTFTVVLQPTASLQIHHDAIRVCVNGLRLTAADRLSQDTHLLVLELELVDMRRHNEWIQGPWHCGRTDDGGKQE